MMPGTKRFIFFQRLLLISLMVWIIWLIKIYQINLDFIRLNYQTSKTLKINSADALMQIIGGVISGTIGFVSAMLTAILIYHFQQRDKKSKKLKEYMEELYFEISHNMVAIKGDLDQGLLFYRRLETNCWNATISAKLYIDGTLKTKLSTLYADFDLCNFSHELQRSLILQGRVVPELFKKDDFLKVVYNVVQKINAILFGEMVRLGYRQEKDWAYPDIIDWKKCYDEFKVVR